MAYILLAFVFSVAVLQLVWLKGTLLDRLVCSGLRLAFLASLAVLVFMPRFEEVTRTELPPVYMVLDDSTASVRPHRHLIDSWKQELVDGLVKAGTVTVKKFPMDSDAQLSASISQNLSLACAQERIRAVFILTDGWEPGAGVPGNECPVPVFAATNSISAVPHDLGIVAQAIPASAYINENAVFRFKVYGTGTSPATVEFYSNGVLLEKRAVAISTTGELVEFVLNTKTAGPHFLEWKISGDSIPEQNLLNNHIETWLQVSSARLQVLVSAQSPSFALYRFLTILSSRPSLAVSVHYPELLPQAPVVKPDVLVQFGQVSSIQGLSYDVPTLIVLPEKAGSSGFAYNGVPVAVPRLSSGAEAGSMRFSEGLGMDSSQLVLKGLKPLLSSWVPQAGSALVPLMQTATPEGDLPLVWQILKKAFPVVVVSHPDLFTLDYFPSARQEHYVLMGSVIDFLVSRLSDRGPETLLRLEPPRNLMMEGEEEELAIHSDRASVVQIRQRDQVLWQSRLPARLNQFLPAGAYQMVAMDGGRELGMMPLTIGLPMEEFIRMGTNRAGLESLAHPSGLILSTDREALSQIPARILQKELVMESRQIDLQASGVFVSLMGLFLVVEWLYRFQRRMV